MYSKLKDFFAERYKILIPIMVVIVLFVAMFFLYREYKFDNFRDKKEEPVYQHFGGVKVEYNAIVTYDLQKKIREVIPKDKKINYDATPIYYQDREEVLFPEEMIVAFPLEEGGQYRAYKYSSYIKEDETYKIRNLNETGIYEDFFMYDGKGLFFFPVKVNLIIGGKQYKELSGSSYIDIINDETLIYYDYESDKSEVIDINNREVSVESKYINIDLIAKNYMSFGKKIILYSNLNLLDTLYKTN